MDPIHPIAPGPPLIARGATIPVERLERVSRERDRPNHEDRQSQDGRARRKAPDPGDDGFGEEDDGRPHVDVRV